MSSQVAAPQLGVDHAEVGPEQVPTVVADHCVPRRRRTNNLPRPRSLATVTSVIDDDALLRTWDEQIRRAPGPVPGFDVAVVHDPAPMLRMVPHADHVGWGGGVLWSDLDETTADAAIAAAVEWFHPLQREWEWKHFAYDRPADLPGRLRAAGFEPDEEEALVVGTVDDVRQRLNQAAEPSGVTIRLLREDETGRAADWRAIKELNEAIYGGDATDYVTGLAASLTADPDAMSVWLAESEDGTVVCAARVNFHAGTEFASLWGGGTLESYRGRGIYKALVARRADEAAERGFRYLQVDASPNSRPILQRLGMRVLTTTTPYLLRPE